MASVTHRQSKSGQKQDSQETPPDKAALVEPADFELDSLLRTLRVDQWFAMAEEGMPLWVC